MEKPKQSPARYISKQSTADLKRFHTAMKRLADPMGPVNVLKYFKMTKDMSAEEVKQFEESQNTSKTLLPIVNAELKKRNRSSLIERRKDGG